MFFVLQVEVCERPASILHLLICAWLEVFPAAFLHVIYRIYLILLSFSPMNAEYWETYRDILCVKSRAARPARRLFQRSGGMVTGNKILSFRRRWMGSLEETPRKPGYFEGRCMTDSFSPADSIQLVIQVYINIQNILGFICLEGIYTKY